MRADMADNGSGDINLGGPLVESDDRLIRMIVDETNEYLDSLQAANRLWDEMEGHMHASYLAEKLGQTELVPRHLYAVTRLFGELHD